MRKAVAAIVLLALLLWASPAAAAQPESGYWTRTASPVALPAQPPSPVPEGGSWVAGDPSGPQAVTALRVESDPDSIVVGLVLTVADQVGTPGVLVCPTAETWAPQQGGRLEVAPKADCTLPLPVRLAEGKLVLDLPEALRGEVVDLFLQPAPGSTFSLTFERLTPASVLQAPRAAPEPPQDPVTFPDEPISDPGLPAAPAPVASAPGFSVTPPLPAAPVIPPPVVVVPSDAPAPITAGPQRAVALPTDRTASLTALALLVAMGAVALRLGAQPARAPQLLGGASRLKTQAPSEVAGQPRGVGRFQTPRTGPPVRL